MTNGRGIAGTYEKHPQRQKRTIHPLVDRVETASREEINFLRTRGVELNAMTAPQFVTFPKRKFVEQEVQKVVPASDVLERHARRLVEQRLANELLRDNRPALQARAASIALPDDLDDKMWSALKQKPGLSWAEALSSFVASDTT
jgi:hypothetical protein